MFTKKKMISQEKVHELVAELRAELTAEIDRAIAERRSTDDPRRIDDLYCYQHALEHSRMNVSTLSHRIDVAINY